MKTINILLSLFLSLPFTIKAIDITIPHQQVVDNVTYTLYESTLTATLSKGDPVDRELTIPSEIVHENHIYTVTAIGDEAFAGCLKLKRLSIPNTVTSVGNSAFADCPIEELYVDCPEVGTWFMEKNTIKTLTLGNSVTKVREMAFNGCTSLTEVNIGTGLSTYQSIFRDCPIETVYMNAPTALGWFMYSTTLKNITFGDNVSIIGGYSFHGCSGLSSVKIPDSVTKIEGHAFELCKGLVDIQLGNSVSLIEDYAFTGDSSLTNVVLPGSLTSLGWSVFQDCSNLTEICIPDFVTSIGDYAFANCNRLKRVSLGQSLESVGGHAFYNCPVEELTINCPTIYNWFSDKPTLKIINIGLTVNTINAGAFDRCTGLEKIYIPDSVTEIGDVAFEYCSGLSQVFIGPNVSKIGAYAFVNCDSLEDVIIADIDSWGNISFGNETANPVYYSKTFRLAGSEFPVEVLDIKTDNASISPYAFTNAHNLKKVRLQVSHIGEKCFAGCGNITDLFIETTELDQECFRGLVSLKNIYSATNEAPSTDYNVFSNYQGVTLNIPEGSIDNYLDKTKCWYNFLHIQEFYPSDFDQIFASENDKSGIDIRNLNVPIESNQNVYSLQGILLKRNLTNTEIKNMPPGIYIVNGKKIAIK